VKPIADQALAIVHEIAASDPVDWNICAHIIDDRRYFGWTCALCDAFAARACPRMHASPMRDDEHHSECLWRRARTLVGAIDPHAKQDAQ
jgi:hypothetical protein